MAHIEGEVLIRRRIGEVFDFVADERTEPTYNRNMAVSEKVTAGPIGVGTRFRATIRSRPRPLRMDIHRVRSPPSDRVLDPHDHRGLQRHADLHPHPSRHPAALVPGGAAEGCRPVVRATAHPGRSPPGTTDVDRAAGPPRGGKLRRVLTEPPPDARLGRWRAGPTRRVTAAAVRRPHTSAACRTLAIPEHPCR